MSVLDNFTPFNFGEGLPTISITKNGITFSKGVVMKLNYPEYVLLLIDKSGKQIAVKACDENEPNAASFCTPERKARNEVLSIRWNQKDLLNTISSMMNWDLVSGESYKSTGFLLEEETAILFDLDKAMPL